MLPLFDPSRSLDIAADLTDIALARRQPKHKYLAGDVLLIEALLPTSSALETG